MRFSSLSPNSSAKDSLALACVLQWLHQFAKDGDIDGALQGMHRRPVYLARLSNEQRSETIVKLCGKTSQNDAYIVRISVIRSSDGEGLALVNELVIGCSFFSAT